MSRPMGHAARLAALEADTRDCPACGRPPEALSPPRRHIRAAGEDEHLADRLDRIYATWPACDTCRLPLPLTNLIRAARAAGPPEGMTE
jgi:hypothetical protein